MATLKTICTDTGNIIQVLCLDECTANVDTQTASKLQNAISSECRGMTVITIAHRISTVSNMDNILILDQGVLVCLLFWKLYLCDVEIQKQEKANFLRAKGLVGWTLTM